MPRKSHADHAKEVVDKVSNRDRDFLGTDGIEPSEAEAIPYHTLAMRTDLAYIVVLLTRMSEDGRKAARYTKACAALLLLIFLAFCLAFGWASLTRDVG